MLECAGIYWNTLRYTRVSRSTPEYIGVHSSKIGLVHWSILGVFILGFFHPESSPNSKRFICRSRCRGTGESADGALENRCEDKRTKEAANGALHNGWHSGTLRVEMRGQQLQRQQNHARGHIRPVRTCLAPHPKRRDSNGSRHMSSS